jgi:hypothetical protein
MGHGLRASSLHFHLSIYPILLKEIFVCARECERMGEQEGERDSFGVRESSRWRSIHEKRRNMCGLCSQSEIQEVRLSLK